MYVVATAGHVDHGKSTLVRALTEMEPDRWAEERRRGMTIDLGFAWAGLPSGRTIAFVDVPGHARFVANMLAGVGPVPAVMMVVAADGGWAQQSEEHLAALDALGVRHGLLVVTRSDLADPAPALAQAAERIAATSLGQVAAVAVSGATGAGLPELRAALDRLVAALPAPDPAADVRLWVDRVFTIRGSGTVVTGTLGGGTLTTGDALTVAPRGLPVRVRGLQTLGQQVQQAEPVARVAVNLRGVEPDALHRGDALVTPGRWPLPEEFDARLTGDPAGEVPAELVLHIGSAAVPVRVRPLDIDTARIRLASPLPLRPGDRALLRDPGAHRIAAGITVLDVSPPPLRRRGAAAARATQLTGVTGRPDPAGEVHRRGLVRRSDLAAAGVLPANAAAPTGTVAASGWLLDPERWAELGNRLYALVIAHARDRPLDAGLAPAAVAHELALPDPALLDALVVADRRITADRGRLRPAGTAAQLPPGVETLRRRLADAPFTAPEAAQLLELRLTSPVLGAAVRAGLLDRLADGVYLRPEAADLAVERLRALPQPFTTSEARSALGTSRRVALPLLESLDARGRTVRVDNAHRRVRDVP